MGFPVFAIAHDLLPPGRRSFWRRISSRHICQTRSATLRANSWGSLDLLPPSSGLEAGAGAAFGAASGTVISSYVAFGLREGRLRRALMAFTCSTQRARSVWVRERISW